MARIVHFEIPARDPEKVTAFYRDVFGWQIQKWEGPFPYWLVSTGAEGTPGIDGAFYQHDENGFMKGVVNTVDVDNIDAYVEKAIANGGKVVQPKGPIPGMGWVAYVTDPEGTLVGIYQNDPNAPMPQG